MAGYTRQSETDIQATNVVKAKSLNDEYDQLLAAFNNSSGHSHDGTAAEGGPITVMKDADGDTKIQVEESADEDTIRFDIAGTEQIVLADGVLKPTTDNDIDLGTSSLEFKDGYFDGTIHVDTLDVDVNATVAGTLGVTGTTTLAGILSLPDGSASAPSITNTGDTNAGLFFSASDEIAFTAGGTAQVIFADGSIAPETDNDIDLGSASYEFKDLYLDGTAHIDTLDVDVNATVAGTLGVTGATTLGGILSIPDGSASNPSITNTGDTNCGLFFSASDEIAFTAGGTAQVIFADGSITPQTDNDIDLGSSSYEFKDGYFDGTVHTDAINLNGTAITSTAAEINILDGVTSTAAELNILDGVTSTAAELNTLDGVTAVVGELNALDLGSTAVGNAIASKAVVLDSNKDYTGLRNVTATGAITAGSFVIGDADINENDLESIDGITAGTIAASKAAVVDSNKDITGFRNVTLTGELDAATLDISGDADIDGTLETDALSINGTAVTSTAAELNTLDGITAVVGELNALDLGSTAVGTAIASKAVVLDSNKDYTGIRNFTITGNLTVGGTQTVVDTVTMNAQNAIVFEGATADDHETTLTITDPTADRTIKLPNQSGTLPVLAADSNTAITSTPAELNLLDGVTATTAELNILDGVTSTTAELNILDGVTSTAAELNIVDGNTGASSVTLADADRIVVNDDGTMKQVALTTLNTYIGSSTTTVGALNSGSITSGFGSINNGSSAITTTGTITYGSLSDGTITVTAFVDEDDMSSNSATLIPTQQSVKAYTDTVAGQANNVTGLTASGAELNVLDGASAGTIVNSKGVIYSSGGKVNATSLQIAGTDLTATAAEFNLLDGNATTPGTTTVAGGDGIVTNDVSASSGTMRQTTVDTFDTYLSGTTKTLTNKTLTSPVLTTPKIVDGGFIADANGNEILIFQTATACYQFIRNY